MTENKLDSVHWSLAQFQMLAVFQSHLILLIDYLMIAAIMIHF